VAAQQAFKETFGDAAFQSATTVPNDQGHNAGEGNAPLAGQMYRQ
jgi:hypothetical protein